MTSLPDGTLEYRKTEFVQFPAIYGGACIIWTVSKQRLAPFRHPEPSRIKTRYYMFGFGTPSMPPVSGHFMWSLKRITVHVKDIGNIGLCGLFGIRWKGDYSDTYYYQLTPSPLLVSMLQLKLGNRSRYTGFGIFASYFTSESAAVQTLLFFRQISLTHV